MDIRELTIANIEAIKTLMLDIFSKAPWEDRWTNEQLHAYVSELIGNKNSLSFGAYKDEILIGMALGRVKSWYEGTEYWIDEFGILPEMQQSGLGNKFIHEIEQVLAGKGFAHIVLLTERNVPAYRFYQKNGFEEMVDTVFFVKPIKS